MKGFCGGRHLGVIGPWFRAFGSPDTDPGIRGEPQPLHPSQPQTLGSPNSLRTSNLVKATQTPSQPKSPQSTEPWSRGHRSQIIHAKTFWSGGVAIH